MATKHLSPTAKLLRRSRLFSLPPPLPRPSHSPSSAAATFDSDTATLPYPTHASIETTQSSLARGDWGLKRALPQKSTTATTTPIIRIGAIDSIYHITDFDSAADHALTLRKWQEMNIPISMPKVKTGSNLPESAVSTFEEDLNRTEVARNNTAEDSKRWRYQGPWLAGKTQGEFEDYVAKKIKGRRSEFRKYLRDRFQEKMTAATRRTAIEQGEDLPIESTTFSEQNFQAEVIKLRQDPAELWVLIWNFLDLPGSLPGPEHVSDRMSKVDTASEDIGQVDGDISYVPPSTHPSAGLSYLRTGSHVPNHPILGPMNSQPPVVGRILHHGSPTRSSDYTMVGVGGVVAVGIAPRMHRDPKHQQWTDLDPDLEGGAKAWVHPQRASINPSGRILLSSDKASDDTVALWEGVVDKDTLAAYAASGKDQGGARSAESDRSAKSVLRKLERKPLPTKVYHDPVKREKERREELADLLKGRIGEEEFFSKMPPV